LPASGQQRKRERIPISRRSAMRLRSTLVAVASLAVLAPGFAGAVLDPAIRCQAIKLKLAGKYASCRLIADSTAVKNGTAPDYSTCDAKITAGWQKVEESIGTECPTTGDLEDVQDSIVECLPSTRYLVRFHLTSDDYLGALQIEVDYSLAAGEFEGADNAVSCTNVVPDTLYARDDDEATDILLLGWIDLDGDELVGPREIAHCVFDIDGFAAPVPGDFTFTVVDSVDTNGFPVPSTTVAATVERLY
jgi:hypothetical protein